MRFQCSNLPDPDFFIAVLLRSHYRSIILRPVAIDKSCTKEIAGPAKWGSPIY